MGRDKVTGKRRVKIFGNGGGAWTNLFEGRIFEFVVGFFLLLGLYVYHCVVSEMVQRLCKVNQQHLKRVRQGRKKLGRQRREGKKRCWVRAHAPDLLWKPGACYGHNHSWIRFDLGKTWEQFHQGFDTIRREKQEAVAWFEPSTSRTKVWTLTTTLHVLESKEGGWKGKNTFSSLTSRMLKQGSINCLVTGLAIIKFKTSESGSFWSTRATPPLAAIPSRSWVEEQEEMKYFITSTKTCEGMSSKIKTTSMSWL